MAKTEATSQQHVPGWQSVALKAFGATTYGLTVISTMEITPHFRSIRFLCPEFFERYIDSPTVWLRLWVPSPAAGGKPVQRAYTVIDPDRETGTFTLQFALHEPAGPGALWAAGARVGDVASASFLRGTEFREPQNLPDSYLLIGDSSSIPAINTILAAKQRTPCHVLLEYQHHDDMDIPIARHPDAEIQWIPRRRPSAATDSLRGRDWSGSYAWMASETSTINGLRKALKTEFGVAQAHIKAQVYWREQTR